MELGISSNSQPGAKPGPFMAREYNVITPKILATLATGIASTSFLAEITSRPKRATAATLRRLQLQGRIRRLHPGIPGRYGKSAMWALTRQ